MRKEWKRAWAQRRIRLLLFIGLCLVIPILATLPLFFVQIEARKGIQLNDFLLSHLPTFNLSVYIFLVIWGTGGLFLLRSISDPKLFIKFTWSYLIVSIFRVGTIYLVPLDPPKNIHELADPLTGVFYGHMIINKDLFFSGHTSILFLIFLCMPAKRDKRFAFGATVLVAIMLLIQHVHYTIDVLAAPFFTYFAYLLTTKYLQINDRTL
ncbi:phosphatase PAP2-related protein [Mucilaginibacter sp. UYCu711]|uniref:phosphatase PAP2-related protein n=1 Tax=Mucilaginibacter sp. UYCu711 TaxID=3156339 RepID=UPI003D22E676